MPDMLTSKDLQDLLHVDRSTIYRMAESGRLPAIKVGKQWRFPRQVMEQWLQTQSETLTPASPERQNAGATDNDFASLLPMECIQLIQDVIAEALGVMMVVTNMEGHPLTQVSHACGLFKAISNDPHVVEKCAASWQALGTAVELEPRFVPSSLGLLCARGLIRVGAELKGMVIVGGIAPPKWPPDADALEAIASKFEVSRDALSGHLDEVFYLDGSERNRVLSLVQRVADVIGHIVMERRMLKSKLEAIAEIAR